MSNSISPEKEPGEVKSEEVKPKEKKTKAPVKKPAKAPAKKKVTKSKSPSKTVTPSSGTDRNLPDIIRSLNDIQRELVDHWKTTSETALGAHSTQNTAILAKVRETLDKMVEGVEVSSREEGVKVKSELDDLASKLENTRETNERDLSAAAESLQSEINSLLMGFSQNVDTETEALLASNRSKAGEVKNNLSSARGETEKLLDGKAATFRDTSDEQLKNVQQKIQGSLNSMVENVHKGLDSFTKDVKEATESATASSKDILSGTTGQISQTIIHGKNDIKTLASASQNKNEDAIKRVRKRSDAGSNNLLESLAAKTDSFGSTLRGTVSEMGTNSINSIGVAGQTMFSLIEKTDTTVDHITRELRSSMGDGLGSVKQEVSDLISTADDTYLQFSSALASTFEILTVKAKETAERAKSESDITTKVTQEKVKQDIVDTLDELGKKIFSFIDGLVDNTEYTTSELVSKFEAEFDAASENAKTTAIASTDEVSATGAKTLQAVSNNISEIEMTVKGSLDEASNFLNNELVSSKVKWDDKKSLHENEIKRLSESIESEITKETKTYSDLIDNTLKEQKNTVEDFIESVEESSNEALNRMIDGNSQSLDKVESGVRASIKSIETALSRGLESTSTAVTRKAENAKSQVNSSAGATIADSENAISNLQRKLKESTSEITWNLRDLLQSMLTSVNKTVDDFAKYTEDSVRRIASEFKTGVNKGRNAIETQITESSTSMRGSLDDFLKEYNLQSERTHARISETLVGVIQTTERLHSKWLTTQEDDFEKSLTTLRDEYRKLQVVWNRLHADKLKELSSLAT